MNPLNLHTDGVSHGEPSESRRSEAPYTKVYFLPFPEVFFIFQGTYFFFIDTLYIFEDRKGGKSPRGDEAVPATDGEKKS